MESKFNRRVLASRPAEQNIRWQQILQQAGFAVLNIPLMEIVELTDDEAVQKIKNRIIQLDLYDGVIFVSQNAVVTAFDWIEDYWPQLPAGIRFYAVGKKTAEVIEQRVACLAGFVSGQTIYAEGAMDSEALLAQLMQHGETDKRKFLICRGAGGRPVLGDELTRKGARVDYCELYRRQLPAAAAGEVVQIAFDAARDVLTVFSGETLDNLVAVFKKAKLSAWRDIPIVVPGKRVAEKARASFDRIIVAENATDEAMLNALVKFVREPDNLRNAR